MTEAIPPLRRSFEVRCSVEHAFDSWTRQIQLWWPLKSHSVGGVEAETVTLEPSAGGRIFERTRAGVEYAWGLVTVWEPPHRLGYRWFIRRDPSQATDIVVSFEPGGPGLTRVSVVQAGWEKAGPDAAEYRRRNEWGWDGVIPAFVAFVHRERRDP